jgi:hypothetical protein
LKKVKKVRQVGALRGVRARPLAAQHFEADRFDQVHGDGDRQAAWEDSGVKAPVAPAEETPERPKTQESSGERRSVTADRRTGRNGGANL